MRALLALGALWHFDRTRTWESPRWNDPALVELRAAPPSPAPVETWAVAVNPACTLCRGSLGRAHIVREGARAPVRLAVLVVDTRRRPPPVTLASLPADQMRWDSTGAWRRRWGHRVYGELLCFDRAGRFVRTLPPLADSMATRRAFRIARSLRPGAGT